MDVTEKKQWMSLPATWKISAIALIFSFLLSVFFSVTTIYFYTHYQKNKLVQNTVGDINQSLPLLAKSIWYEDYESVSEIINDMRFAHHILGISIFTLDDTIIEKRKSDEIKWKETLQFELNYTVNQQSYVVGYMLIDLVVDPLFKDHSQQMISLFFLFLLFSSLMTCLMLVLMKREIVTPLKVLTNKIIISEQHSFPRTCFNKKNHAVSEIQLFIDNYNHTIHSLKESYCQLRKEKQDAVFSSNKKNDYLANMSHEIRTPMNGIIGMTSLLKSTPLNKEQLEFAEMLEISSLSLLDIINDILDFSKIEAGKLTLQRTEFNLQEWVSDIEKLFTLRAKEKNLALNCYIDNPALCIYGDPARLRQIIINLISNAIKFTAAGSVIFKIKEVKRKDNKLDLLFEVKNTGIGINPDDQKQIFNKFEQVQSRTSSYHSGTGLGLAISSQLVEMMGGILSVDSKEGKGSRFYFNLLFDEVDNQYSTMRYSFSLKQLSVLLVEDSPLNAKITEGQLTPLVKKIYTCSNEKEAVSYIEKEKQKRRPVDIVILDKILINTTGFALAETLQQHFSNSCPHLMMITAEPDKHDDNRLQKYAIKSYLVRPYKVNSLKKHLYKVMENGGYKQYLTAQNYSEHEEFFGDILVVEDSFVNQKVIEAMLHSLGLSTYLAKNGKEAILLCEKQHFDLIFMDCHMPVVDGYRATRIIRQQDLANNTPIVALTANASVQDKSLCLKSGMDDYLSKPVGKAELIPMLHHYLPSKNQTKQNRRE